MVINVFFFFVVVFFLDVLVVGIIMGLDFDLFVMVFVVEVLDFFGVKYELIVVFVYRIFERMVLYV